MLREAWWKCHSHSEAWDISLKGTSSISHPKPAHAVISSFIHSFICHASVHPSVHPSSLYRADALFQVWGAQRLNVRKPVLPALRGPAPFMKEEAEQRI